MIDPAGKFDVDAAVIDPAECFAAPTDVLNDLRLTPEEKRRILESWALAPTSPLVSWHFLRMWRSERAATRSMASPAAYVCRNGTCSASVMTAKALIESCAA